MLIVLRQVRAIFSETIMTLFVASVITVLLVSAICSLTEAALYSVRLPYARRLAESGSTPGRLLQKFKLNMERPIAAILILNTVANTAGAAVAGAQAGHLFGDRVVLLFSAGFTLAVLFFSEIIPKVMGVTYNRPVARYLAVPLNALTTMLYPVIRAVETVTRFLQPENPHIAFPEDEVRQVAMLSAEEGSILESEAELVKNALALDQITARDIMTPRPVVQKLASDMTVRQASNEVRDWTYSRIPVHASKEPDRWVGVALSRDILAALARDEFDLTIGSLARPIDFVPESTRGHVLLRHFLNARRLLSGVVDEYGSIVGIVTLEDVLESIIGHEIMDEVDVTADLQALAKRRKKRREGQERP
jgi:CBS domain containing-hemolysin-like protein